MASLVALVGFALSAIILNLTIRLFYRSAAKRLEELAAHLRDFILGTCEVHRMRPLKIRVINDPTPTAFTYYGWSPRMGRILYSRGWSTFSPRRSWRWSSGTNSVTRRVGRSSSPR